MVVVFGVSQGLGYSLVKSYLSLNVKVIGVGRRNSIIHPFYHFIEKDLSESNSWEDLLLTIPIDEKKITVIYNAGNLGEVGLIQSVDYSRRDVFQLNFFSWIEVVQSVLKASNRFHQINFIAISSGAGRRGIAGWSQYGATKAALDNFMMTLKEEMCFSNLSSKVYSISPGVMNTEMQKEIRGFSSQIFPSVAKYIDLNEKALLSDVDTIAKRIISFISNPSSENVLIGIQEI